MSKAIMMVLQGGLGNQLFQYAAGVVLSKELGGELWLTAPQENIHSQRDYRANLFLLAKALGSNIFAAISDAEKVAYSEPQDPHSPWSPSQYHGIEQILLKGYWQYLPAIVSSIPFLRSEILTLLGEIRVQMHTKYAIQDTRELAFVHVRRGDYLSLPETDFWRQDIDTYYREALATLRQGTAAIKRILVISDDIAWCKAQPLFNEEGIECIEESDELAALAIMSLCHGGAVITNSTFSWWGAMFGPQTVGAKVVYPERWYKTARPQLFPDTWVMVQQDEHRN